MEKQHFDKIEKALSEIQRTNGEEIYTEAQKSLFNEEVRKQCADDEIARDILLTLIVNDVFMFLYQKDYVSVEKNVCNCLTEFQFYESEFRKLLEILKVSDELQKIKHKKKLAKIRRNLIVLFIIALPIAGAIFNYNSYFHSTNEIHVKDGTFLIGEEEQSVSDFFIAKTECADESGFPIVNMSWYEVVAYCNSLSERNGLECVYTFSEDGKTVTADITKCGYRLPTREEWYWAATGAGKNKNQSADIGTYAWYIKNSDEKLHKVGTKSPNELGLYDMFGNTTEWIWNTTEEKYRTVCGGFYGSAEKYVRADNFESKHKADFGEVYIGFRLARSYVRKNKAGAEK